MSEKEYINMEILYKYVNLMVMKITISNLIL